MRNIPTTSVPPRDTEAVSTDGAPAGLLGHGHAHAAPDDLRTLFREHGLRCTRQREQIYTALAASKTHPTADELHVAVKDADGGLSLATVYNTLEAFTEKGLCRRLPASSGSGPCRFDADVGHHAHIMLEDGRVLDLPNDLHDKIAARVPQSVLDEIEARLGVRIEGISLQITGRQITGRQS